MLTQRDIKEIRTIVKEEVSGNINHLPSKDEFYSKMDELMGEIKAMREEITVVTGYKDQIEDHEIRIGKLEDVLQPQNH